METLKKLLILRETQPFSPPRENLLYLGNGNPEKILILPETELSYISGNRTFLYFGKGIVRTLTYSKSWYIQNPRHIQNTFKHLRWNVLQK